MKQLIVFAILGILIMSIVATVQQASALTAATFTDIDSITGGSSTQFQRVYNNSTHIIFLHGSGGTLQQWFYDIATETLTSDTEVVADGAVTCDANVQVGNVQTDGSVYVACKAAATTNGVFANYQVDATGISKNNGTTFSLGASTHQIVSLAESTTNLYIAIYGDSGTTDDAIIGVIGRDYSGYAEDNVTTNVDNGRAEMSLVIFDASPNDIAYLVAIDDTSNDPILWKWVNGTPTSIGTMVHASNNWFGFIGQASDKLLIRTDTTLSAQRTYLLETASDTLSLIAESAYTSKFLQTMEIDENSQTFNDDDEGIYSADTSTATGYNPSTGEASAGSVYIETVNNSTGTLTQYSEAKMYRLSENLLAYSTTLSGTTWTITEVSDYNVVNPTVYAELVGASLVEDSTIGADGVLRMICDNIYTIPSAKTILGDDSDCTTWRVVAESSATVGREQPPYSRTSDLVHANPLTAYTIVITDSATPNVYYVKSIYDSKTVDQEEFDSGASVQQRYLYGQCYTMQIINENTDEQVLVGDLCANDITTKEISLTGSITGHTVPITGQFWERTWTLGEPSGGFRNINYTVTTSQQPFNVSLWVTDALNEDDATIAVWHNYTNADPEAILAMTNIAVNQTIYVRGYSNDTLQFNDVIAGNPIGEIENPIAFLGTLGGIPFIVLVGLPIMAAIFTKKYEVHAIVLVMIVTGVMYAIGWLPFLDPIKFALIIVVGGIGIFAARSRDFG